MTVALVLLGSAVLATTAIALKDYIHEQWYIWQLESEGWEEQKAATEKLVALKSVRAIPCLLEALTFEERRGLFSVGSHSFLGLSQQQEFTALAVLGIARERESKSIAYLTEGLQHEERVVRRVATFVLKELGNEAEQPTSRPQETPP